MLLFFRHFKKMRYMPFGQDPAFKGITRDIRTKNNEILVFNNNPFLILIFLLNNIAKDAPLPKLVVAPRAFQFFQNMLWDHGKRNNLAVAVLDGSAGRSSEIFKNNNIFKPLVLGQVPGTAAKFSNHLQEFFFG